MLEKVCCLLLLGSGGLKLGLAAGPDCELWAIQVGDSARESSSKEETAGKESEEKGQAEDRVRISR
jgi:hypothetical protein